MLPLGLSGLAFGATSFLFRYQYWILALSLVTVGLTQFAFWRSPLTRRSRRQQAVVWGSTGLTLFAIGYNLYTWI